MTELEKLKSKVNCTSTSAIETDREYYIAAGQVVRHIFNKAIVPVQIMSGNVRQLLNCKDNNSLGKKIKEIYKKYNYKLDLRENKFNNLYAMFISYIPEDAKTNVDMLEVGLHHSSIIY